MHEPVAGRVDGDLDRIRDRGRGKACGAMGVRHLAVVLVSIVTLLDGHVRRRSQREDALERHGDREQDEEQEAPHGSADITATVAESSAMKASLKPGLSFEKKLTVDEARCIGFMGKEGMVYATPKMVSDVEYACRDWLLAHLEEGEDSVGARVEIDHLAATPLGLAVSIQVKVQEIDRRRVTFEFSVKDPVEECGRGRHVRFVVETAKTRERLAAKRAKAGLK